jgi:hypothetical protein
VTVQITGNSRFPGSPGSPVPFRYLVPFAESETFD